jgi:hypothetical protein
MQETIPIIPIEETIRRVRYNVLFNSESPGRVCDYRNDLFRLFTTCSDDYCIATLVTSIRKSFSGLSLNNDQRVKIRGQAISCIQLYTNQFLKVRKTLESHHNLTIDEEKVITTLCDTIVQDLALDGGERDAFFAKETFLVE